MAKTPFKLKSGNTTPFKQMGSSPAKQVGGDAGEAVDHWKKYKAAKAQDKAVEKLATNKNISRKAFDTKLAKITKTVDPHPSQGIKKVDKRALKEALKQSSKYDAAKKHLIDMSKKSKTAVKPLIKKAVKKTAKKSLSRAIPVIGAVATAVEILKPGVKRVIEGIKTGKPKTKLTGKNIKDTFKRVEKKKYI